VNAPELLREAFLRRSWKGESITFSGNTDCYQPIEASYRLTRRCLEVCLEFQNPVHVITKGALIRRDIELLAALTRRARCSATVSIPFSDDEMGRKIEPLASACSQRFETVRALTAAGISTGVNIAPVIPGLNDTQIPEILARAREAGAVCAALLPVRLAAEVLPVFRERLVAAYPQRAAKVESAIMQIRRGKMNESAFGDRMRGFGPRWQAIQALFDTHCRRLGLDFGWMREDEGGGGGDGDPTEGDEPTTFRRPSSQQTLF
jgi:DNA repair photolyase